MKKTPTLQKILPVTAQSIYQMLASDTEDDFGKINALLENVRDVLYYMALVCTVVFIVVLFNQVLAFWCGAINKTFSVGNVFVLSVEYS